MTSVLLCIISFIAALVLGRRSRVAGLVTVLAAGYFYGIIRANLPETFSHFIFDASIAGLYLALFTRRVSPAQKSNLRTLKLWVLLLSLWPILLFLVPAQDPMVELVGLRAAIFMLPFLLIGARLSSEDLYKLALCIAVLNVLAFGLAIVEFVVGVAFFFPKNAVTEIVYMSQDLMNNTEFRIPSSFTGAHAYAATMVVSVPILIGGWVQRHTAVWKPYLLIAGLLSALLGVFMTATRSHVLILFLLLIPITLSGRLKTLSRIGWCIMLLATGWIVSKEERLQRFMTLRDTDYVTGRIAGSVNRSFIDTAIEYPLGNGLGGGGTSIPYFLRGRVKTVVVIENEYARIMLDQGLPGLGLWIAFLFWVFTRRTSHRSDPWWLARRLVWYSSAAYFASGLLGLGLLTSIPQTCLMLLGMGWISVRQTKPARAEIAKPFFERETMAIRQLG